MYRGFYLVAEAGQKIEWSKMWWWAVVLGVILWIVGRVPKGWTPTVVGFVDGGRLGSCHRSAPYCFAICSLRHWLTACRIKPVRVSKGPRGAPR